MAFEDLIRKVEKGHVPKLEEIIRSIPGFKKEIKALYESLEKDIKNLVYLLGVTSFFDDKRKVIEVILRYKKFLSNEELDFKQFYIENREAYKRRCANNVPHKTSLFENFLEAFVCEFKEPRLGCGSPNYVQDSGEDPSWHNIIKTLEDGFQ